MELAPVGSPGSLPSAKVGKRDAGPVSDVPGITREQRAGFRIDRRHDRRRRSRTRRAEHPLDIGRDRQPPDLLRRVPDRESRNLDRVVEWHELQEFE
jgi:hypothetical protein